MGKGQGVGTGIRHWDITCVLQTEFSSTLFRTMMLCSLINIQLSPGGIMFCPCPSVHPSSFKKEKFVYSLSESFQTINFKLCTYIISILKMCI